MRLPNPPSGTLSWLGKKRSYESNVIRPLRFMASVRIVLPNFLTLQAGMGSLKKVHTWAPLPERERSILNGILHSLQMEINANTSFLYPWVQFLSSKSAHRKEHLLSEVTTYRPITSHPFSSLPSRCRYMSWLVNGAKLRLGHSAHLCFFLSHIPLRHSLIHTGW